MWRAEYISTGESNKLWAWVWHSPKLQKGANAVMPNKLQKGANAVMPNKLQAWVGTASPALEGKMQCSCFCWDVYIWRGVVTGPSCSRELQCHVPTPRTAAPPHFATVCNKLTGGGGGWCVSIWPPSLHGPSFVHVLSSGSSHHSQLNILGQTSSCGMWEAKWRYEGKSEGEWKKERNTGFREVTVCVWKVADVLGPTTIMVNPILWDSW
jgi:hypothetical protein